MTRYAHAKPGENCTRCNDPAVRVVAAHPLCTDHFDLLVGAIHRRQRWKTLTPPDNPTDAPKWRTRLDDAVAIGIITHQDAENAWKRWKQTAA